MFMDAGGAVCTPAVTEGEPAAFEVAEELVPFGVGRPPVLLAWAQGAAAGDEGPVPVDGLVWIDRLPWLC